MNDSSSRGRTFVWSLIVGILALSCGLGRADVTDGLIGHWDFREGDGLTLHDCSGNANHGTIHNARWVAQDGRRVLEFREIGDHVHCGQNPILDLRGQATIAAWIYRKGCPSQHGWIAGKGFTSFLLTDGGARGLNWFISHENYPKTNALGTMVPMGSWQHVVATFDGKKMSFVVNGEQGPSIDSQFRAINPGGPFVIGGVADSERSEAFGQPFLGLIGDVRVYKRSLTLSDVQRLYIDAAGEYLTDASPRGELVLTPYVSMARERMVVNVDYQGLWPVEDGWRMRVEARPRRAPFGRTDRGNDLLRPSGEGVVRAAGREVEIEMRTPLLPVSPTGEVNDYIVSAELLDAGGRRVAAKELPLRYPAPTAEVPSPSEKIVESLPPLPAPVSYDLRLNAGGGFDLVIGDAVLPVESTFSYPRGGENRLTASGRLAPGGEAEWQVSVRRVDDTEYAVTAAGRNYRIERQITMRKGSVWVRDRFVNPTDHDVGIIVRNQMDVKGLGLDRIYRAGYEGPGALAHASLFSNIYAVRDDLGAAIVTRDDVYSQQSELFAADDRVGIGTSRFGLAAGASYDLQWAVYLTGSGDWYDYVNAVREGEGITGRIEGNARFLFNIPAYYGSRRRIPGSELVRMEGVAYGVHHAMLGVADDPGIVLNGIDFMQWPRERGLLRLQYDAARRINPGLHMLQHVALHIYNSNNEKTFTDARILDREGVHVKYGTANPKYMSQERLNEGWADRGYYPHPDNSFHRALMQAVDVLMDEIGADGVFWDGATTATETYDRWDGHTVEIHPETKEIVRKYAIVNLINRESVCQYLDRIRARGGSIVGAPPHHALVGREGMNWYSEQHVGPMVHFFPTPMVLGAEWRPQTEAQNIRQLHHNLGWGALTYTYTTQEMTHESVWRELFPITFEEIRPGYVRGRERLITTNPGPHGWRGDDRLHVGLHYDARGCLTAQQFWMTVDGAGVRTAVALAAHETAILKPIPVRVRAAEAVNLVVHGYAATGVNMTVHGHGRTAFEVADGDFRVRPGAEYKVRIIGREAQRVTASEEGLIVFDLPLDGTSEVMLAPVFRG